MVKVGKVAQKRWDDFIHGVISPPEHRGNVLNGPLPMGIQDIVGLFVAGVYQVKDIDAVSGTFVLSMSRLIAVILSHSAGSWELLSISASSGKLEAN